MSAQELRKLFLDFFEKRGHKVVPSSSLIPDDPSVLLTTAGMQQFKKYYTESSLAPAKNIASIQKCFRTSDIDKVGDESHLTFFEMLGNFSFGGYWKKEAIEYAHEFITKELGLKIDYVTVFGGGSVIRTGDAVPVEPDKESESIWRKIDPKIHIELKGREDNFWGPTGTEGPCGPTTEIYVNGVEVWNIVFNHYYHQPNGILGPLKTRGVDTGMGLERLAMVSQGKKNIFETDLFLKPLGLLFIQTNASARIAADHLRGTIFLLADGVRPSNKATGYVLRRLIRRLLINFKRMRIPQERLNERFIPALIDFYGGFYPVLTENSEEIIIEFNNEVDNTKTALERSLRGLDELSKKFPGMVAQRIIPGAIFKIFNPYLNIKNIAKEIFDLHQTYALPLEDIKDYLKGKLYQFNDQEFDNALQQEIKKHQEISRAGLEKKFGGHGLILDTGELKAGNEEELKIVTRLHTATHLLQAALRKVLGEGVEQRGSDITSERTRFDFLFPRKLTKDELRKVEELVNYAISKNFPVTFEEMPLEEAKKSGALFFYKGHYPALVKVYTMGNGEEIFSKELCGGPHVSRTQEIGRFKIIKEEASSAGVRRIRAVVK